MAVNKIDLFVFEIIDRARKARTKELKLQILKENDIDKILEDFFLMLKCKNYAVGPTTFHWWSAWLNNNPDKICVRPHNLNPSNNIDFWPESWDII